MERTQEANFLVHEPDNSSVFSTKTNKRLWFEVLEGEDKGIRVSIPLFDQEYDESIEETLFSLSDGDIVTAVLQRDDPNKNWYPISLEKER